MTVTSLKDLFIRDLKRLKKEIESYSSQSSMWQIQGDIFNSAGNLCLHLIGNLKHFIGRGLADTDYVRDRNFEFSGKDVSKEGMLKDIEETIEVVEQGFDAISDDDLMKPFPIVIWEEEKSMIFTLIHLYGHMNYHLGQINYHRRLLDTAKG